MAESPQEKTAEQQQQQEETFEQQQEEQEDVPETQAMQSQEDEEEDPIGDDEESGEQKEQLQSQWESATDQRAVSAPFPRRLYELLQNEDENVVSWTGDGKSFRIHNPTAFSNTVLPKYFRHSKLTSLQRQLNLYGFAHVTKGPIAGSYLHPLFQRDQPQTLDLIKRSSRKPTMGVMGSPGSGGNPLQQGQQQMPLMTHPGMSPQQQQQQAAAAAAAFGHGMGWNGILGQQQGQQQPQGAMFMQGMQQPGMMQAAAAAAAAGMLQQQGGRGNGGPGGPMSPAAMASAMSALGYGNPNNGGHFQSPTQGQAAQFALSPSQQQQLLQQQQQAFAGFQLYASPPSMSSMPPQQQQQQLQPQQQQQFFETWQQQQQHQQDLSQQQQAATAAFAIQQQQHQQQQQLQQQLASAAASGDTAGEQKSPEGATPGGEQDAAEGGETSVEESTSEHGNGKRDAADSDAAAVAGVETVSGGDGRAVKRGRFEGASEDFIEAAFRDLSTLGLDSSPYRDLARKLLSQMDPVDALTRALAMIVSGGIGLEPPASSSTDNIAAAPSSATPNPVFQQHQQQLLTQPPPPLQQLPQQQDMGSMAYPFMMHPQGGFGMPGGCYLQSMAGGPSMQTLAPAMAGAPSAASSGHPMIAPAPSAAQLASAVPAPLSVAGGLSFVGGPGAAPGAGFSGFPPVSDGSSSSSSSAAAVAATAGTVPPPPTSSIITGELEETAGPPPADVSPDEVHSSLAL
mmetsp:Transcript_30202/g.54850  ORF Transcript_30202/g.54850 Transcript_30202/m.54850 type:complete len:737 (+) Transcript_30202:54-2264(+)